MGITKKFTILHSNDMHGDFLTEVKAGSGHLIGGLALLSGYVNKVRREEKNVLYVVAGDMLQGSLIDSEYQGISTMEIMNYLAPDVVSLGNHEFDYGLPQLLFLEKMANFPIITANLYIKQYGKRLMKPYLIINKDGFDLMFIGILTDRVIDAVKKDKLVGSFISLEDAAHEVGIITDAYKNNDIDLTVLLTHIGYDSDIELAKLLKPEWGVDMIIGGHSHTILQQPALVNNVLIAQAGVGTNQIGRFDIVVDDDTNSIVEWKWQLIPIEEGIAEPDIRLKEYIAGFADEVDRKYNTIICKFTETLERFATQRQRCMRPHCAAKVRAAGVFRKEAFVFFKSKIATFHSAPVGCLIAKNPAQMNLTHRVLNEIERATNEVRRGVMVNQRRCAEFDRFNSTDKGAIID